jgi:tripartite ATP-independent transporter DctM subunit
MSPEYLSIVILLLSVTAILLGIPVAFALGGIPILFALVIYPEAFLGQLVMLTYGMMTDYVFIAVPLFILMGAILERSGMADNLYKSFYYLFGRLNGGLAVATVSLATLFAACQGVVGAGVITVGLIALPAMLSRGYSKKLATGSICVGGGLGVIIPPSVMFILYGSVAGVSIADLFIAGILPGLLLSGLYNAYIIIRSYLQPEFGPAISKEELEKVTRKQIFRMTLTSLVPPLALILLVLGSIFFGVVAPSEAAAIGSIGGLGVAAVSRKLTWKAIKDSLMITLRISSMVLFIALGGKFFMVVVLSLGAGELVQNLLLGVPWGTTGVLLILLGLIFILGCFTDWVGLIFIIVPIASPIVEKLNVDPLYFGMLFCVTLQVSNMTPPFAYSAFYLKGISPPEVTIGDIYLGGIPFIYLQVLAVVILIMFPQIVLYLPSLMAR